MSDKISVPQNDATLSQVAQVIIDRITRERDASEARSLERGRMLLRLRDALINIKDAMEDEGDRVYFGSTNDADQFREEVNALDGFAWESFLGEADKCNPFDALRDRIKERDAALARAEAAEGKAAELAEELSIWKSVFPDIAPERVLPSRSLLEAKAARAEAAEAEVARLLGFLEYLRPDIEREVDGVCSELQQGYGDDGDQERAGKLYEILAALQPKESEATND